MADRPTSDLRPATSEELEHALAHALRFDGKRAFKLSSEMMARITAKHLAECLRQSRFVVMKDPAPMPRNNWPTTPREDLMSGAGSNFDRGMTAHVNGLPVHANPHAPGTAEQADWDKGWHSNDGVDRSSPTGIEHPAD